MRKAPVVLGILLLAAGSWHAARQARAAAKLRLLEDILRSRNDNDPRLDTEFDGLAAPAERLFRRRYRELAPERRNDRGTIVYLLGRNLDSAQDWEFFREVVSEPPCLSLADCSKKAGPGSMGDEVTLAYPPLVALRQTRMYPGTPEALAVIRAARASRSPIVARAASSPR